MKPSTRCPVTIAILTGGASSRMGAPKHLVTLADGRRMIDVVVAAVGGASQRVVIAGRDDAGLGVPFVPDLRSDCGPLAGIEALLASGFDDAYVVVPTDMVGSPPGSLGAGAQWLPRLVREVPPAALMRVLHVAGESTPRALPAWIHVRALRAVRMQLDQGERAVWRLAEVLAAERVGVEASVACELADVDTPRELEAKAPSS